MLTTNQIEAARLFAQGLCTVAEISQLVGVSTRTLHNWKNDPEFQIQLQHMSEAWRQKARLKGIGDPDRRLLRINDRWRRLQSIIEERAADPAVQDVPGGKSGLLAIDYRAEQYVEFDAEGKPVRCTRQVPVYQVDTGLVDAMRKIEEHAAIHEGQWKTRVKLDAKIEATEETPPEAITLAKLLGREGVLKLKEKLRAQAAKKAEEEADNQ
jgi:hypothetical protein